MKERQIDLTKQELNPVDEAMVEDNAINFAWELWFDVDKYFGTHTDNEPNTWINFYTVWHRDINKVRAYYVIDSETDSRECKWILTKEEEKFLKGKMEEYVGGSLKDYYDETVGIDNIYAVPYTYKEFKSMNDAYEQKIGRILDVHLRKNTCVIKVQGSVNEGYISKLVFDVANGVGAVSNPSVVQAWSGFRK